MTEKDSKRKYERVSLPEPLNVHLGASSVVALDISLGGCRIEHRNRFSVGAETAVKLCYAGEEAEIPCRVVRCKLQRFQVDEGGAVYQTGVIFDPASVAMAGIVKKLVVDHVSRALEEQKANAHGDRRPGGESSPIFNKDGLLAATDRKDALAKTAYVKFQFEKGRWKKSVTFDPDQPDEGFTVASSEDEEQLEILCRAYQLGDPKTRQMIRICAEMSVAHSEAEPSNDA
jgi:PilZ domain.